MALEVCGFLMMAAAAGSMAFPVVGVFAKDVTVAKELLIIVPVCLTPW